MERQNRNKPLTPEMKGKLITLYQSGKTYSSIAAEIGVHVRIIASTISHFYISWVK